VLKVFGNYEEEFKWVLKTNLYTFVIDHIIEGKGSYVLEQLKQEAEQSHREATPYYVPSEEGVGKGNMRIEEGIEEEGVDEEGEDEHEEEEAKVEASESNIPPSRQSRQSQQQ